MEDLKNEAKPKPKPRPPWRTKFTEEYFDSLPAPTFDTLLVLVEEMGGEMEKLSEENESLKKQLFNWEYLDHALRKELESKITILEAENAELRKGLRQVSGWTSRVARETAKP